VASGKRDRPGGQTNETGACNRRTSPPGTVIAPWSDGTVAALNAAQRHGCFHPYTCREDRHAVGGEGWQPRPTLTATSEGWECPDPGCDQDQHWADASIIEYGQELLREETHREPA
jgi:hypothetical protein